MIEVKWGSLGLKDSYLSWLARKWIVSMTTMLMVGGGAIVFILEAFEGRLSTAYVVGLVAWVVIMLCLSLMLTYVNYRLHSIERFLGFYDVRHEVRHQEFCTNHIHCLGLHYFKSFDEDIDDGTS
jgi:hypothetical protein